MGIALILVFLEIRFARMNTQRMSSEVFTWIVGKAPLFAFSVWANVECFFGLLEIDKWRGRSRRINKEYCSVSSFVNELSVTLFNLSLHQLSCVRIVIGTEAEEIQEREQARGSCWPHDFADVRIGHLAWRWIMIDYSDQSRSYPFWKLPFSS